VFNFLGEHVRTFPAFGFVASSKRLKKYSRYTDQYSLIVESGYGGNMYVYYLTPDGMTAKQVIVRLGVDSLGIGYIQGVGVVIIGQMNSTTEVIFVRGL
jgi:hypothetical protein